MDRENLKSGLFEITNCDIQHDGWPCNTCFHALELDIEPGRLHELWESVLAYRGDYTPADVEQTTEVIYANIDYLCCLLERNKMTLEDLRK